MPFSNGIVTGIRVEGMTTLSRKLDSSPKAAAVAAFFIFGGLGGSAEFGFQRVSEPEGRCGPRQGMTAFV